MYMRFLLEDSRGRYPNPDLFDPRQFIDANHAEIMDWLGGVVENPAGNGDTYWIIDQINQKTGIHFRTAEQFNEYFAEHDIGEFIDRHAVETLINAMGWDWDELSNYMVEPKRTEGGWIVHFTNFGERIIQQGFAIGAPDHKLGVTQRGAIWFNGGKVPEGSPGWSFGFPLRLKRDLEVADYFADAKPGYGSQAVFARVRYQRIYHHGDLHDQAIFWGPDAKDLRLALHSGNDLWHFADDDQQMSFVDLVATIRNGSWP